MFEFLSLLLFGGPKSRLREIEKFNTGTVFYEDQFANYVVKDASENTELSLYVRLPPIALKVIGPLFLAQ